MKHFCVDREIEHLGKDQKNRPAGVNSRIQHVRVELKVCEGCGALWLRAQNANQHHGAYCQRCALRLSDFPPPRERSRAGRKRKLRLLVCEGSAK